MKLAKDISILMISLDPGLAGVSGHGDVVERHLRYAQAVKKLAIVVLGGENDTPIALADNLTVYPTGSKGFKGLRRGLRIAETLAPEFDLIDTQDPHATGYIGLRLKKKFGKKLEVHFHGDFWYNPHWLHESWKNYLYNYWQKQIVRQADGIRVVSQGIADKLIASHISADRIRVINTPVDTGRFAQVNRQVDGRKKILFVGRLVKAKNIFFLLTVMDRLRHKRNDFTLQIVGQGELQFAIQTMIKTKKLTDIVDLSPAQTPEQLARTFQSAYALVLLSTNESFGKLIVEAGVAGVPTVASRTTGAQSIISDGQTGLLVDINNAEQTITALEKILDDTDSAERLGRQAKIDYLQRFSSEQAEQAIINFWTDLMNY